RSLLSLKPAKVADRTGQRDRRRSSAPAGGRVLGLSVLDVEPGDLAAHEDVVLGAQAQGRVERRGVDLDEIVGVHEAEEARAAGPAELALRARVGLVRRELVRAGGEGERLLRRLDE